MLTTDKAISVINARRMRAEEKRDANLRLLQKDPTYLSLDNRLGALRFEKAKRVAYGEDLGTLIADINATQAELDERRTQLGMTAEDTKVQYYCEKCRDSGFVGGEYCSCLKKIIFDSVGRIGDVTDVPALKNVDTKYYGKSEKAYKNLIVQLQNYVDKFPYPKQFLILSGTPGVGKSFFAGVIANELGAKGYSCLFMNAIQLNELFLKRHLAPIEEKEALFEPLLSADLLVIDDLGCESFYKNVTNTYLYLIMVARGSKNTLITTNLLSKTAISDRYDQRIASRLTDVNHAVCVNMSGSDLR